MDANIFFQIPALLLALTLMGTFIYIVVLVIRALQTYIRSREVPPAQAEAVRSLGETIKALRMERGMTQEFVAEQLGVSRQAVSKWEMGQSDPSTSNLLALARLFEVSPTELLRNVY